jgi:hypothetical protein
MKTAVEPPDNTYRQAKAARMPRGREFGDLADEGPRLVPEASPDRSPLV